jgi:hypothetical protein
MRFLFAGTGTIFSSNIEEAGAGNPDLNRRPSMDVDPGSERRVTLRPSVVNQQLLTFPGRRRSTKGGALFDMIIDYRTSMMAFLTRTVPSHAGAF